MIFKYFGDRRGFPIQNEGVRIVAQASESHSISHRGTPTRSRGDDTWHERLQLALCGPGLF